MKIPSLDELKLLYSVGNHKQLSKWIPHLKDSNDPFVRFLLDSNLLFMGKALDELKPITLGADPEFILADKDNNVVLFSSELTNDAFGMSEAEVGADYGLLELRPGPGTTPEELLTNIMALHKLFEESYGVKENNEIRILETEAVDFEHKKQRLLKSMEKDKDKILDYGGYGRGKDVAVWTGATAGNEEVLTDRESATTFSAYDNPNFPVFNPDMLTAGGHIHVGGTFVKMLSFSQLKQLVRKFDEEVLPLCIKVETKAGEKRREVYGQKGEFRIKDYGIEYRSPSNAIFWKSNLIKLQEVLTKVVDITKKMALI